MDKYGNIVRDETIESHIPLIDYNFKHVNKLVSYE